MGNQTVDDEKGAALILSLLMLTILSILAATTTSITNTNLTISGNYVNSQKALFAAEAGIDYGRDALLKAIRDNGAAWNNMLSGCVQQYPEGTNCAGSANSVIQYEPNVTWDSVTLTNNRPLTNIFVSGASGPTFSLRITDNNDQDGGYLADSDYILMLQSVGTSGNASKTIQTTVSCPNCEAFYSQERYAPENPGAISTQAKAIDGTLESTFDIPNL